MPGAKSPVPRLDMRPTSLHPEASQVSTLSVAQSRSSSSASEPGPPNVGAQASTAPDERWDPKAERLGGRLTQAHQYGKVAGVPALTPLTAILGSNTRASHSAGNKPSRHAGRVKALLRERAAARGMSRPDTNKDSAQSAHLEQRATSNAFRTSDEPRRTEGYSSSPTVLADKSSAVPTQADRSLAPEPGSIRLELGHPLITDDDIHRALRYFVGGAEDTSFSDEQLLARTAHFYPGLSLKDTHLLMGHGVMSADKLRKVVRIALHKDLAGFDPVAEAFKVLDPRGTGHADLDILGDMLSHLPGIHKLSAEDRAFLLKISDIDGDGLMTESDFRRCSTFLPATPQDQAVAQDNTK